MHRWHYTITFQNNNILIFKYKKYRILKMINKTVSNRDL